MKKRLLYIIDNVNYKSGAQKVTAYQIKKLSSSFDISIFSFESPDKYTRELFSDANFIEMRSKNLSCLNTPFFIVMKSKSFSLRQKLIKILFAIGIRFNRHEQFIEKLFANNMYQLFNQFDTVCVVSEASKLRKLVSNLIKPKKIQWIHTDYVKWSEHSDWTRMVTQNDTQLYAKFDHIVCVSQKSKQGFVKKYPEFEEKTIAIKNLIPVENILQKSTESCSIQVDRNKLNIITVGRLDKEKAFDRILEICKQLVAEGFSFQWYIVGDGVLKHQIEMLIEKYNLNNIVYLTGEMENPYPLMRQCNILALLSLYEGLPVTVEEALVLSVPVIATDVGGIAEQIEDGKTGILVANDKASIYNALRELLDNKESLSILKQSMFSYISSNEETLKKIHQLF